jgi:hypothetical protein
LVTSKIGLFAAVALWPCIGVAHESTLPAYLAALQGDATQAPPLAPAPQSGGCRLTIDLVDAQTGTPMRGLVRVAAPDGRHLDLPPLFPRATALSRQRKTAGWHVSLQTATITVPQEHLVLEAFAGLETERALVKLDLRHKDAMQVRVKLRRFYDAAKKGLWAGNTHLHLQAMSRPEADRYLTTIPPADGLDVVFVSYVQRQDADKGYVSNQYRPADLAALGAGNVALGWGEEHRHNFTAQQGYGHVMLLDIERLVKPVSIGPDIMKSGTDAPPLRPGILDARSQGAKIFWCHGKLGHEDIPSWLDGVVDAQNILDDGDFREYSESFYRYLNVGLKVPFATGTDWFIYDFARAYVPSKVKPSTKQWLDGLTSGRSFITNGPFLELTVAATTPGDSVPLGRPGRVPAHVRAVGRHDFGLLQIMHDGEVAAVAQAQRKGGHYQADLRANLDVSRSGWVAARIRSKASNELGEQLFAHTSPVYLEVPGTERFDIATARSLLMEMKESIETIGFRGKFADETEKTSVLTIYTKAIQKLEAKITAALAATTPKP